MKNDFEIKAYIVNQEDIQRKISGEYIALKEENSYLCNFDEGFNLGIIHIDKNSINKDEYVLISIKHNIQTNFQSDLLVEIISNEYPERYFIPINQYIIETFGYNQSIVRNENKYSIDINDIRNEITTILIEFSPNYNDLELKFETKDIIYNISNVTGFQKYRIISSNNTIINFTIKNTNKRKDANYILRYFYTYKKDENNYILDENFRLKDESKDSEKISISLTFPNIKVLKNNSPLPIDQNYNITFFVYAYLFSKEELKEELVNTSACINNRNYLYKAETISIYGYSNIYLFFQNILRQHNYKYELQIRVNVYISDSIFNEEFLTYSLSLDLTDIKEKIDKTDDGVNIFIWIIMGVIILNSIIIFYFN